MRDYLVCASSVVEWAMKQPGAPTRLTVPPVVAHTVIGYRRVPNAGPVAYRGG